MNNIHETASTEIEKIQEEEKKKAAERAKALEEHQSAESQKAQEHVKAVENAQSEENEKSLQEARSLTEKEKEQEDAAARNSGAAERKQAEERDRTLRQAEQIQKEGSEAGVTLQNHAASLEELQRMESQKRGDAASKAPPAKRPAGSGSPRKPVIAGVRVDGSTVISRQEIDQVTSKFIGKDLTLDNLAKLAGALAEQYKKKGYLLAQVYVPPQNVQNGIATLMVLEGRLGAILIEGNNSYREAVIKYFLSAGVKNGVIRSEKIQRALFLLNELPNFHAQTFLQAGTEPGTTDIVVKVVDKTPIHEILDYNNFGNDIVGKSRAALALSHGDLSGRADQFTAKMIAAFPSRENPFLGADYSYLLDPNGTRVDLSYSSATLVLGQAYQPLDIRGSASIYGLTLSHPFVRTEDQASNVSLSFYAKNANNFLLTSILNTSDRLRELAAEYNHRWPAFGGVHFMDVTVTQGLGTWFKGMGKNDPFVSRAGADDTFTKLNGLYNYSKTVFGDNILILRGSGQYASSPLSTAEQFSIGGPDSVHGYLQSEFLGDSGWNLNVEYRYPLTQRTSDDVVHLAFFLDEGYSTLKNPGVGETSKRHLSGAGIGLRATIFPATVIRVDLGFPLDPPLNQTHENPVLYLQGSTQL